MMQMKYRLFPVVIMAACAVCTTARGQAPVEFSLTENSMIPPPSSSLVALRGGAVVVSASFYSEGNNGSVTFRLFQVTPTAEQWKQFRRALDDVKVWQWHKSYSIQGVSDGLAWSLHIKYSDKQLNSEGSNAYPVPDDPPREKEGPAQTTAYKQFKAALDALLGDRKTEWDDDDERMMGSEIPSVRITGGATRDALDYLLAKGTLGLKAGSGDSSQKLNLIYRYDTAKKRKPVNLNYSGPVSFLKVFTNVLKQEDLDYEVTGKHTIVIKDR